MPALHCLHGKLVKRYDVQVAGRTITRLEEAEINSLFYEGRINRDSPCRDTGATQWTTVNELLPLLKYGTSIPGFAPVPSREATLPNNANRLPLSPALKSGWICFGLGAVIAWFFPLGHLFYSIALIMAIVVMCTERGPRGLILMLTTFIGMISSVFITLVVLGTLAFGVLGASAKKAQEQQSEFIVRQQSVRATPSASRPQRSVAPQFIPEPSVVTKRSVPSAPSTPVRTALRPAAPTPQAEEITIPLNKWSTVTSRYGSFGVKIVDHGPVTFSVWIGGSGPRRIEKVKGFETTGTNITPIHSLGNADIYYVDRISVSLGHCVLKVIPRS